jgi:hypothetical protein
MHWGRVLALLLCCTSKFSRRKRERNVGEVVEYGGKKTRKEENVYVDRKHRE